MHLLEQVLDIIYLIILGIVTAMVRDAGHTQVTSGTATVLGMGPAPSEVFSKITGKLKLL